MERAFIFLFVALITFGFQQYFYKLAMKEMSAAKAFLILSATMLICGLILYFLETAGTGFEFNSTLFPKYLLESGNLYPFLGGLTASISFYTFLIAVREIPISIAAPIRNLGLLVTAALGIFVLREELTFLKTIGFFLAIISIILLAR